jgi:hypothetical protein
MGMQVLAQKLNPESTNTIRCSMLEAGIYFVSIETAQGKEVFKLIKK